MKISLYNIGCKVNFAEMSQIGAQFAGKGYEIVEFGEESDIVLINTCTVTNRADADCRKLVRRAIRNSPNAFIGVMGCFSQLKPGEASLIEGVDAVFGNAEKFIIPEIIEKFEKNGKAKIYVSELNNSEFKPACSADNESHSRATLKLQDGCDYNCSYCTIPLARGPGRSMDFGAVKKEFLALNNSLYKEVVLSGINLGEYRAPGGEKFVDVLKLACELDLNYRIRISSIEPNLVTDEIIELTARHPTICPHFHIPLQSGSPEILRLMRRRYKAEHYADRVRKIKELIPHCCVGGDVISGFPGETDDHFEETYQFIKSLPISYLHPFSYSERENTVASALRGQVNPAIVKERTNMLVRLSAEKRNEFYKSQIGQIVSVIPEAHYYDKGISDGWSENYIRISFNAKDGELGGLKNVILESAEGGQATGSEV